MSKTAYRNNKISSTHRGKTMKNLRKNNFVIHSDINFAN